MSVLCSLLLFSLVFCRDAFAGDYTKMEHVVSLDQVDFEQYIQSNRWLILFYRKSCGGCQRYSEFFKNFALYVYSELCLSANHCHQGLNPLIIVGAIDCELKLEVCRNHSVQGVPHLQSIDFEEEERAVQTTQKIIFNRPIGVYADDIFLSLSQMLESDIGTTVVIAGEELAALKEFINMLYEVLPCSPSYRVHLQRLSNWVKQQTYLTGNTWANHLRSQKFPLYKGDYVECKGSEERFRGYPCGLWLLFHALTVRHYELREVRPDLPGDLVAHALNRFVPRFFSCTMCAFHFAANTANIPRDDESILPQNRTKPRREEFEWDPKIVALLPRAPESAETEVLWLNAVHNRVNQRLARSETEDPMAPKITFPPRDICSNCWSFDGTSNEWLIGATPETKIALLEFLVDHYLSNVWLQRNIYSEFFDSRSVGKLNDYWTPELVSIMVISVLLTLVAAVGALLISRCVCRRRRGVPFLPGRAIV